MSRIIAVEEHDWTPHLRKAMLEHDNDETITAFSNADATNGQLLETGDERLARISAAGADFQVLSTTVSGTQQLRSAQAGTLEW